MTALRPRIDWRSLDRAALGEAYNSAAAVANCGAITASWEPRSAAVRQRPDAMLDLEPMRHCYVNDKLGLDEAMAQRNSPIRLQPSRGVPLAIVVGGVELPLMLQQSADYAEARCRQGLSARLREIPGADHFSILDEMERSDGLIVDILRGLKADAGL